MIRDRYTNTLLCLYYAVNSNPTEDIPPNIVIKPADTSAVVGEDATFECVVSAVLVLILLSLLMPQPIG